jgi:hypothetical protein
MGQLLFIFIALLICVNIITQKGVKKLFWFFVGILFIPQSVVIISNPYTSFPRFLIIFFLIILIFQNKQLKKQYENSPLYLPLNLVLFCLLLIGIFDSRIDLFTKIARPTYFFIENFSLVFLTYFYIKTLDDLKKIYNFIMICFIIFGSYGIINYLTGVSLYNSFIAEMYNSIDFGNLYTIVGDSRFRISSFAWHPIYYGLLLSLSILIVVFIYFEKKMQIYRDPVYIIILSLLAINLFFTNSRTPLISLIIGLIFFYLFALKLGNKIRVALIGIIVIIGVISISPGSLKLIDESIDTFTSKGSKLEGSSVEMREVQMAASLLIFSKSPIFGNGFGYITEDLGFSSDINNRKSDSSLSGFESYIYKLLIEQGSIGFFANLFFFTYLFIHLLKTRKKVDKVGKNLIFLSISMTITFLLFIIGTGDMGGFMVFMALLGVNLKGIQLSIKKNNFQLMEQPSNFIK